MLTFRIRLTHGSNEELAFHHCHVSRKITVRFGNLLSDPLGKLSSLVGSCESLETEEEGFERESLDQ